MSARRNTTKTLNQTSSGSRRPLSASRAGSSINRLKSLSNRAVSSNERPGTSSRPKTAEPSRAKLNLASAIAAPTVDWEFEGIKAYGEYMEAIMRQRLVTTAIHNNEPDLLDQLATGNDDLHRLRCKRDELREEAKVFEVSDDFEKLMEQIQTVEAKVDEEQFESNLEKVKGVLMVLCNQIQLDGVAFGGCKEGFRKLGELMRQLEVELTKFEKSGRQLGKVAELVVLMKKVDELIQNNKGFYNELEDRQAAATFKILQKLSNGFADTAYVKQN